jgi:hypothetical protein
MDESENTSEKGKTNTRQYITEIKEKLLARDGARCQISGEPFRDFSEMAIDHIVPLSLGGSDQLDNMQLIKAKINSFQSNKSIRRAEALTKDLLKRQEELAKREQESFERESDYRSQIDKQKLELERLREELLAENEARKQRVDQEIRAQQERLREQRASLEIREIETSHLKQILQEKITDQEIKLKNTLEELEREKERYHEESRNQIQARSNSYVNEAITALDTSARRYHSRGSFWSIAGLLSLAGGVGTGIYFGLVGITALENSEKISWPVVSFLAFKGVIVIGLFVALAKYCFTYSQSFTHEAIKNSERKHAINFGKFYLETYGAEAEWAQVKEAFEHWNINSSSAFSGSDPDKFDPKLFDRAIGIAEAVQKLGKSKDDQSTKK